MLTVGRFAQATATGAICSLILTFAIVVYRDITNINTQVTQNESTVARLRSRIARLEKASPRDIVPAPVKKWFVPDVFSRSKEAPIWMPAVPPVEYQMAHVARNEPVVYDTVVNILSTECLQPSATFVDSGANEGMWSLLAAKRGCKAIAVEPQLLCLAYLAAAAAKNSVHVHMYHNILAPAPGFAVDARTDECFGTTQFRPEGTSDAYRQRDHTPVRTSVSIEVLSQTLDDIVGLPDKIVLWHIDTEGAEIAVLRSARRLFDDGRIERVIMEWYPTLWSLYNIEVAEGVALAIKLFSNWTCHSLTNEATSKGSSVLLPIPVMWQQTLTNVYCIKNK